MGGIGADKRGINPVGFSTLGCRFLRSLSAIRGAGMLLLGLPFLTVHAGTAELHPLQNDSKPNFFLSDLAGGRVDLSQWRGQVLLVHFFATWCEPCREELPALQRLAERSAGVSVIAISVGEPELRVRRFAETAGTNFPILLDGDQAVARSWQVVNLPTTYVLDRDLNPTFVAESDVGWDALDLAKLIEHLAARDVGRSGPPNGVRGPNSVNREE